MKASTKAIVAAIVAVAGIVLVVACGCGGDTTARPASQDGGLALNVGSRSLSYNVPCHFDQGGDQITIEDGCTMVVESGGVLDLESGASVTGVITNDLDGAILKLDPGGNTSIQATANYQPIITLGGTPTAAALTVKNSAATAVAVMRGSGEVEIPGSLSVTGVQSFSGMSSLSRFMVGATPASTPAAGGASVAGALAVGSLSSGGAVDAVGRLMVGATPASTPVAGAASIAGALTFSGGRSPLAGASAGLKAVTGTNTVTGTLSVSHGLTTVTWCLATLGEDSVGTKAGVTTAVAGNACTVKVWNSALTPAASSAGAIVHWLVIGAP